MPDSNIKSYRVGLIYVSAYSGMYPGFRYINLEVEKPQEGISSVNLQFMPSADPNDIGRKNGSGLDCKLPVAYYSEVYDLIRTEKPVSVGWMWNTRPNPIDRLYELAFDAAGPEPPGEGLDTSL